jgi:hypothetical protein
MGAKKQRMFMILSRVASKALIWGCRARSSRELSAFSLEINTPKSLSASILSCDEGRRIGTESKVSGGWE